MICKAVQLKASTKDKNVNLQNESVAGHKILNLNRYSTYTLICRLNQFMIEGNH